MDEITTSALAKLLDTTAKTIADLGKRGIIEKSEKRGTWLLQLSVSGYVKHLREEAAARGGEPAQEARMLSNTSRSRMYSCSDVACSDMYITSSCCT
jgi:hypothetical protein